jgi:hypothetical protein
VGSVVSRGRWLVIVALAAVSAVAGGCDFSAPKDGGDVFTEITVDLTIDGERGTFTDITRCHRRIVRNDPIGPAATYAQTGGFVAGQLASGKVFILDLGEVCSVPRVLPQLHPWQPDTRGDAAGFAPGDPAKLRLEHISLGTSRWGLFVFDSNMAGEKARYFIGPDYFYQEGRTIDVHSIRTRVSSSTDGIDWQARWAERTHKLEWLKPLAGRDGRIAVYGGLFGQARPSALWRDLKRGPLYDVPPDPNPENAGAKDRGWEELTSMTFISFPTPTLPYLTVEQPSPGQIALERRPDKPRLWTWVYRHEGVPVESPDISRADVGGQCLKLREGSIAENGIQLTVDGADTGLTLTRRPAPGAPAGDTRNTVAHEIATGDVMVFVNIIPCLNVNAAWDEGVPF